MGSDFVTSVDNIVDELKSDMESFFFCKKRLREYEPIGFLSWDRVKFVKSSAQDIPSERGIYAFMIEFVKDGLPPNGYIMYVGETGDTSRRTLHDRFLSYFSEIKTKTRPIHKILRKYRQYAYFHFSKVSDKRRSLKKLERKLCDALVPPCNVRDFSVDLKTAKRAF